MATTIEALAAAAFIDGGDEALETVMKRFGMDSLIEETASLYNAFRNEEPDANAPPARHFAPHIKYPIGKTSI